MPAKSKKQRKFMGMAHAIQEGKNIPGASPKLKEMAKSMPKVAVKKFAATPEKGLPVRKKKKKPARFGDTF